MLEEILWKLILKISAPKTTCGDKWKRGDCYNWPNFIRTSKQGIRNWMFSQNISASVRLWKPCSCAYRTTSSLFNGFEPSKTTASHSNICGTNWRSSLMGLRLTLTWMRLLSLCTLRSSMTARCKWSKPTQRLNAAANQLARCVIWTMMMN